VGKKGDRKSLHLNAETGGRELSSISSNRDKSGRHEKRLQALCDEGKQEHTTAEAEKKFGKTSLKRQGEMTCEIVEEIGGSCIPI